MEVKLKKAFLFMCNCIAGICHLYLLLKLSIFLASVIFICSTSFCNDGVLTCIGTYESSLLFDDNYHCFSKWVAEVFKHESLTELKI